MTGFKIQLPFVPKIVLDSWMSVVESLWYRRVGSSVGLGLFFERWFRFLLILLSPQTTASAGNAPLSLESF